MKKIIALGLISVVTLSACTELTKVMNEANKQMGTTALTNAEIVQGLKDALTQGANKSATKASAVDGFYKNPLVFIPFPPEAIKVKNFCIQTGLTGQVNKFEETLNRAAEEASKTAAQVFIDAIKGMTVTDGLNILRGADTAATHYLREKCTATLNGKFKPIVQNATQKVQLTKYWSPLTTAYNKVPTHQPVNTDLDQYVTNRAIDGLFKLIGQEEKDIRTNPAARATDMMKKVFGSKENPHNH
ncbi:MAG: DUF4197 domain-containing protein [Bacteroidia bacterium]